MGQETRRPPFWLLALLIGSATIGMHIFVPVLPLLIAEFRIAPAQVQLTISLYMFVIAGGQLVYGPLSDRFGRKPVLLVAITLFVLAGIATVFAHDFNALLVARIAQACGGCAGLVLGRAVVHDMAQGANAAQMIARVNAVLLVSPVVAPVIGLWIADRFGWRAIALLLAGLGGVTIYGIAARLAETAPRQSQSMAALLRRYRILIGKGGFLLQVLGGALSTTTMFVLLSATPFVVVDHLDRPLGEAGWFYAAFILALMAGNLASGRLLGRLGYARTFVLATGIGSCGAVMLCYGLRAEILGAALFVLAGGCYTLMSGIMAPLALTRAVDMAPDLRGSASGIFGAAQFTTGALGVSLLGLGSGVGSAPGGIVWTAALVLLGCAGGAFALYGLLLACGSGQRAS